MNLFIFDLIIWMLFISGISMAGLGLYGRRFVGRVPAATPYVLLMFSATAWAVLYALDLLTVTLPLKVFYHDLRFLVLPFFSVLELWLVIAYIKRTEWLRRDWAGLALVIPVIASILALTSPYHTLFRYNFSLNTGGPVPVLQYSESAFYGIYNGYSLALLVLAIVILIIETRKRGALRQMQTVLLLLALAIPTAINYLVMAGLTPVPGVNVTPALLWIPAILYSVALFRYRFLDIVPIARNRLIDHMAIPMLVIDTDCRVIDLNPSAYSLFSPGHVSAIGKKIEELVPDWPELLSLCRSCGTHTVDLARVRKSGTYYYTISAEPLLAGNGEPEGQIVLLVDVTDREKAGQALRESEEKYRTIIENMQDIFYRTDLAGRITMISPSGAALTGYGSPDQMIGLDASALYADPKDRDAFLGILREKGSVYGYPLTLMTRTGMMHYVTTSSHVFRDSHGDIQGVEGVIHDITDQRQAEEALRIANRKLNLLSGITRHDIRNQLMALNAYLQLSEKGINNPGELAGYLAKEKKIAETIDRQIMFTRDYENMGVNAPVWQNVNSCIRKAAMGLPLKDIRIVIERPGLEVFADPLLEKVFYNLIDNALRYGGDSLTTLRFFPEEAGTALRLVFEDDGAGVEDKDKRFLFGKGFGKNTGLGLFLSREILSITEITITETGIPGRGARFEIMIPAGKFRFEPR